MWSSCVILPRTLWNDKLWSHVSCICRSHNGFKMFSSFFPIASSLIDLHMCARWHNGSFVLLRPRSFKNSARKMPQLFTSVERKRDNYIYSYSTWHKECSLQPGSHQCIQQDTKNICFTCASLTLNLSTGLFNIPSTIENMTLQEETISDVTHGRLIQLCGVRFRLGIQTKVSVETIHTSLVCKEEKPSS